MNCKNDSEQISLAIVLITLNEAHNLKAVFENVGDWASEIFVLDSYSQDSTVDICLEHGVKIAQRKFDGFGNQWNAALEHFEIKSAWTMKLDPDERISAELKKSIADAIKASQADGLTVRRRLWFMGSPLPVSQPILRVWKTGSCRFSDVSVNEHPLVDGRIQLVTGELQHHDSPNLEHWLAKQNKYSTAEAFARFQSASFSVEPRLLGSRLQRLMWVKKFFWFIPFRYQLLFVYNYFFKRAFLAGVNGFIWARLRSDMMRIRHYKFIELKKRGNWIFSFESMGGAPDSRVQQLRRASSRV